MKREPAYKVVGIGVDKPTFYKADTQEKVTRWLDELLMCTNDFSLMSKLNDLQTECYTCGKGGVEAFPSKFDIPLMVVNLIIKDFGLEIVFERGVEWPKES